MTLDQIRTLCCLVECGSLKKAAESLHKTQPALSMALKKLEKEYGFEIFNRDNYRLSLTEAGKPFYRKAQELLLSTNQLNSLGQHLGAGNESKIRIGYDSTCPLPLILNVLKLCQKKFPHTEVQLISESRFGALDLLKKGQVDMAFGPWWPIFYALGDLLSFPIGYFKVLLVAAPELFNTKITTSITHLKEHVYIVAEESDLSFDTDELTILKGCRQWTTRDVHTLKQMLLAGLGWGFIPELMVSKEISQGSLIELKPQEIEFDFGGEIRLIRQAKYTLGPVASMIWSEFMKVKINKIT